MHEYSIMLTHWIRSPYSFASWNTQETDSGSQPKPDVDNQQPTSTNQSDDAKADLDRGSVETDQSTNAEVNFISAQPVITPAPAKKVSTNQQAVNAKPLEEELLDSENKKVLVIFVLFKYF